MIPNKYGVGSNYTQYENEEVDRLLETGAQQTDIDERKQTYWQLQEILLDEVPFAPHGSVQQGHLVNTRVNGVKPNQYVVDATWNVHEWSIG